MNQVITEQSLTGQRVAVNDLTFLEYLQRLKDLHNFLYQEAVPLAKTDASFLQMGNLRMLYFDKDGRVPTAEEWNQVEGQTQAIFILLTPALRRKFLMTGTPAIVLWMPVYLDIESARRCRSNVFWPAARNNEYFHCQSCVS
jgi:hypothetical protein